MSERQLEKMESLFDFDAARSRGIADYEPGVVPFVTSTLLNNGVVGYVTPMVGDKVFDGPVLSISGLGDATVQLGRFLPKGNGGDSLTICTPLKPMTVYELVSVAAAFNSLHAWRFSYGRKCSPSRLRPLELPTELPDAKVIWQAERASVNALSTELTTL
ncbi:hypothetical protein [Microbacterium sp. PAMC22086]|uniref:hypothetical protein n=1 Tax=Microbacterium sp. PAMC22086 TaxID=2861281 RepID=UPI001C62E9C3|nr:hypothetical protein [Microbacterium sp. PAMC22086]QYG11520.1 hypothetical protein KY497_14890 [Microbacterium sp. PAMC22086]